MIRQNKITNGDATKKSVVVEKNLMCVWYYWLNLWLSFLIPSLIV